MPYDYEFLKNHISRAHPELLDAFVEGWNNLGAQLQARWRQTGLMAPKKKVELSCWLAWTTIQIDQLFKPRIDNDPFDIPLSKYQKQLAILFHNNMQDADDFLGLPYMPALDHREYHPPSGETVSSSERHLIAKDAAAVIIRMELGNVLMKWKKDFDEYGLDALRRVYLTEPRLEEDNEKKFDFEDFDSDLDCASDFDSYFD